MSNHSPIIITILIIVGIISLTFLTYKSPTPLPSIVASPYTAPPKPSQVSSPSAAAASPMNKITISPEGLDYFFEVVLLSEYGGDSSAQTVKKWDRPIVKVSLIGDISDRSRQCVQNTIDDFNLLSLSTKLIISNDQPDITMHFAPRTNFPSLEANYVMGNDGFFWRWYDASSTITRANILISTDNPPSDDERCHLIKEELTQSMGPANDSNKYPDSIFYGPWTSTQSYSKLDQEVIRLLYNPSVKAGMTRLQVIALTS